MTLPGSFPSSKAPPLEKDHYIDVIDHPSVWLWMKETSKKDPEGFLVLTGPNSRRFQKIFGKYDWHTSDNSKDWEYGWSVYENSMHWLILTGPSGTFFRIKTPVTGENYLADPRVGVGIIQYLQVLMRKINNV